MNDEKPPDDRAAADLYAPGRRRIPRRTRVDVYWVASRAAVKAGFRPETIRLDDPGAAQPTPESAARCRALQAEMTSYLDGVPRGEKYPVGSIAWVIDIYRTDPDSPYRGLRPATRTMYDQALDIVTATTTEIKPDAVTAGQVRRWHREWTRAGANPRRGYACIQVLRLAIKFGKGERLRGCADLSSILTDTEFPVPRARRARMSEAQAKAIIAKAKEMGFASITRAVALQFGCALRQKDVIGEWIDGKWSAGLMWGEHVKEGGALEKPTSKSNFKEVAEFDLKLIPIAWSEMQPPPGVARIGPVILDEDTGRPYHQRKFARRFREIARAAGVPDTIYNMDSRAGAVTDAYNKGAQSTDAMDLATHTQLSTSRRYSRDRLAATGRISELRFGVKPKPDEP